MLARSGSTARRSKSHLLRRYAADLVSLSKACARPYAAVGHTIAWFDAGLQLIESNAGELRISELASQIGVSTRELTRRFENAVGVSPKQHSRITRFVRALHLLRERKHHTLTELALACGY